LNLYFTKQSSPEQLRDIALSTWKGQFWQRAELIDKLFNDIIQLLRFKSLSQIKDFNA